MDAKNLADLYNLPMLEWEPIASKLGDLPQAPETGGPDRHTCWLTTINPDGSPHTTAVGAMWVDGTFWFVTGKTTRKGKNVARDPRCSIAVSVHDFDLAIDGTAELMTDPATVADMAARYAADGWPCRVDDSGTALTADYSAPSAGPPPWHIYRITIERATALATAGQGGATRWTFTN
jgi:PPOX class probable F420-dependent enzyme